MKMEKKVDEKMEEQRYPLVVASSNGILTFAVLGTIFVAFLFMVAGLDARVDARFVAGTLGGLVLTVVVAATIWWKERNGD